MTNSVSEELERLASARLQFLEQGRVRGGLVDAMIERSWKRCVGQGVDPHPRDCRHLGIRDLREVRERSERLLCHAMPELEELRNQIGGSGYSVFLTDSDGVVLYTGGDSEFVDKAQRVALQPGACWNETDRGTNAVGTAIAERSPVMVHGSEHYLQQNRFLTCSAAPICDPHGLPLGVLDISGEAAQRQWHTLALVRMASTMIENRYFSSEYAHAALVRFHARPEFIGTLSEGLAAFDPTGRVLAANRSALLQLGLSAAQDQHFEELFTIGFDKALTAGLSGGFSARTRTGVLLNARIELVAERSTRAFGTLAAQPAQALERLRTGDETLDRCLRQAGKVLGRGIPILIQGETGTGKEVLAKAVHEAGPRHRGPLVTVNCAAFPPGLIESELFGYASGAFTGARRGGALGKIQAAHGGTLFLDEIGDMPLELQTRLLRVLQERQVIPLGGGTPQPVDFDLISATNQDLQQRVARGEFRTDLYYRINGLRLTLPALRERSDLAALARKLLAEDVSGAALAPDAIALFRRHPWPGNIRQLRNVLRTAAAMREGREPIQIHHLPEDFLAEADNPPSGESLADRETRTIHETLEACNGNMSAAARRLGINRSTLYRKLDRRR